MHGQGETTPGVDVELLGARSGSMPAATKSSAVTRSASERRSVFRRCPKPARTRRKSSSGGTDGGPAGTGRRRMATSAESTFGRGRNTDGGTRPTIAASAQYATLTLTAPYALVPGPAASRSPTSACTMTSMRSTKGSSSSRSATIDVAA